MGVALVILNRKDLRRLVRILGVCVFLMLMPSEVRNGRMGNKLQKKHARIDPQYTKEIEEMTGRDFSKEDVRSIMNLPTVIHIANALYGRNYSVRKK